MASSTEFNLDETISGLNQALHSKPKLSREVVLNLMGSLYGLEVTDIKEMNSFVDQNFHVTVSKQHRNPHIDQISDFGYTLKVINTLKSSMEGHFDSMHAAVQQLSQKGLRVPVPVKNLEGKTWHLENIPLSEEDEQFTEKRKCGVYLYTYIPGVPVTVIENTTENLFQWGALLAKFHKALEDLECPHLKSKVILSNLKFVPLIEKFMEEIDEVTKKFVLAVLRRYPTEVTEKLKHLPEGFIHGDFNDHNILAQMVNDPDSKTYVADGILDFEDMHYGAYAWDLGLMLAHASLVSKTLDPLEATGFALAGYRSVRSLTEEEISILKICVECRISQTLAFCSHSAKLDPENTYISGLTLSEEKCTVLDLLSKTKEDDLLEKWNKIFNSYCSNKT